MERPLRNGWSGYLIRMRLGCLEALVFERVDIIAIGKSSGSFQFRYQIVLPYENHCVSFIVFIEGVIVTYTTHLRPSRPLAPTSFINEIT